MSVPRLRAPREHGQTLIVPPLDDVGELLARDDSFSDSSNSTLAQLKSAARQAAIELATQYHQEAGEPIADLAAKKNRPWIVAGHQPELFHPGVWFKNFVLHQLAQKHDAIALNLIIDNDAAKPAVLQVPSGGRLARAPIDRNTNEAPYEEHDVQDEALFASLPERLAPFVEAWNFKPMLPDFWSEVQKQATRTNLMGERIAAARRTFERRLGVTPVELPLSRLCGSPAFVGFLHLICRDLGRFQTIYNDTVHAYRLAHGIRSRSHPVPDLAVDGEWLETPFWAWRRGQARRHKLYLRKANGEWSLRFGNEILADWHGGIDAPEMLNHFAKGLKIRPRALTTTMFARLFLADLFIHGIGGGIYDELTDRIIEQFFRVEAPRYLTVSATLLLPLPRYRDAARQVHELGRRLRDLQYQPERFVTMNGDVESLITLKKDWIARVGETHEEKARRFEAIRAINARLQPHLAYEMERTRAALEQSRREVGYDEVAARRDYAFCLYPEALLWEFIVARRSAS